MPEIKLSIQLTSVFNDQQNAVRRKEYFVLVSNEPGNNWDVRVNTEDSCKNVRSDN